MVMLGGLSSFLIGSGIQPQMPEFAIDLGLNQAGLGYGMLLAANSAGAVLGGIILESTHILKPSVRVAMVMPVLVVMMMVIMMMRVPVVMAMIVMILQMNIELHTGNAGFFLTSDMKVIPSDVQLLQFMLELMCVGAQIQQCGHKHIAADAAENIEVKSLHRESENYLSVSALICAAA